ncbi:hypothetical protein quinque_003990 [Culex quinquefasciatus]
MVSSNAGRKRLYFESDKAVTVRQLAGVAKDSPLESFETELEKVTAQSVVCSARNSKEHVLVDFGDAEKLQQALEVANKGTTFLFRIPTDVCRQRFIEQDVRGKIKRNKGLRLLPNFTLQRALYEGKTIDVHGALLYEPSPRAGSNLDYVQEAMGKIRELAAERRLSVAFHATMFPDLDEELTAVVETARRVPQFFDPAKSVQYTILKHSGSVTEQVLENELVQSSGGSTTVVVCTVKHSQQEAFVEFSDPASMERAIQRGSGLCAVRPAHMDSNQPRQRFLEQHVQSEMMFHITANPRFMFLMPDGAILEALYKGIRPPVWEEWMVDHQVGTTRDLRGRKQEKRVKRLARKAIRKVEKKAAKRGLSVRRWRDRFPEVDQEYLEAASGRVPDFILVDQSVGYDLPEKMTHWPDHIIVQHIKVETLSNIRSIKRLSSSQVIVQYVNAYQREKALRRYQYFMPHSLDGQTIYNQHFLEQDVMGEIRHQIAHTPFMVMGPERHVLDALCTGQKPNLPSDYKGHKTPKLGYYSCRFGSHPPQVRLQIAQAVQQNFGLVCDFVAELTQVPDAELQREVQKFFRVAANGDKKCRKGFRLSLINSYGYRNGRLLFQMAPRN